MNSIKEELAGKFIARLGLLDVEVSPEAVLKIRALCAIVEDNLSPDNPEEIARAESSMEALVLTILTDAVARAEEAEEKKRYSIDGQAISRALMSLLPLFPFSLADLRLRAVC